MMLCHAAHQFPTHLRLCLLSLLHQWIFPDREFVVRGVVEGVAQEMGHGRLSFGDFDTRLTALLLDRSAQWVFSRTDWESCSWKGPIY